MGDLYFECMMCSDDREKSEVVELKCGDVFCLVCLKYYIYDHMGITIKCPIPNCTETLTDTDIRNILPSDGVLLYESLFLESLNLTHLCLLPECELTVEYEDKNVQYDCPNCSLYNCVSCEVAHKSLTCKAFKNCTSIEAEAICSKEIERARKHLLDRVANENRQSIIKAGESDLLISEEVFECFLCTMIFGKGKGIKLRNCFHLVCKNCLCGYVLACEKFPPKCPHAYCQFIIEDREIKSILSTDEYIIYSRKSLNRIKSKLVNHFQCQAPDCDFFCELYDDKIKILKCLKCKSKNCITCKAIHNKETCEKYQKRIDSTDIGANKRFIDRKLNINGATDHQSLSDPEEVQRCQNQIKQGKCMKCPDCQTLVQKVRGCNWIQCSNCGVELCWVLQMRRWGPKGRGDTSGGCQCMVNDVFCHPDCTGCIPHNEGTEQCVIS